MNERAEAWRTASVAVAEIAARACHDDDGAPHWPSVLASLGVLTGEAALIACERDLPDGGLVKSERANLLFYDETESPATLSGYLREAMVKGMGLPPAAAPDPVHAVRRILASLGARPFPPLPPDSAHWPRFWPMNAGPRLRREVHAAMAGHGLKRREALFALNGALVIAILRGRGSVPPPAAAAIGLEAMAAALRWAPQVAESPEEDVAYRPAGAPPPPRRIPVEQLWSGVFSAEDSTPESPLSEGEEESVPKRAFGRRRT